MTVENAGKLKIFVSAYACEPGKGSEIGVGWHWVLEMSRYFELWVMTRANNRKPIETYFSEHLEEDRIHWVYYDLPDGLKQFKHQLRGVRLYYTLWQYGSDGLVKKVMKENRIGTFHLLTYGNAIWHISSYGQRQFFIWGPTGGADTIPREFSKYYTVKHRIVESIRRVAVGNLKYSVSFRKKCKNANLIFCKSRSIFETIPEQYRDKAILFTDVAMESVTDGSPLHVCRQGDPLTFISVGRLDGWRGFDLLVEAFSRVAWEVPELNLKIIGEGAEQKHLQRQIKMADLEKRVKLTGQVTMRQYREEMQSCDAVLNACLKEGGVTNAFDCMALGKPLLCVDTGGYTRNFDDTCAIILPHTGREELIRGLASGMRRLCDESVRRSLGGAMVRRGKSITWEVKGRHIRDEIIRAYRNEKGGRI